MWIFKRQKNGKGKEKDDKGKVHFDGQYLNDKEIEGTKYGLHDKIVIHSRKIKGEGKEYDSYGFLEYEGEYLNYERNGKGKEYYFPGILKFEGEFVNGKEWTGKGYLYSIKTPIFAYELYDGKGFIKDYDNYTQLLIYEGEILNGERNGKAKEYNRESSERLIYEGEFLNGKRNGKGKEFYDYPKNEKPRLKFEGEYFNGERNGKGIRYDYEGEILFEGIYLNGEKWTGKGKEYYTDHDDEDDTDENPFKNMIFNVGKKKKKKSELGFFLGDLGNKNLTRITLNNFGLPQAKKVLKFEGEYLNGLRHGKGKEYNKDKQLIYEGDYLYGKWDGQGKQYYSSYLGKEQLLYEGEFKDGQWDGVGKQYKTGITPGGIEKEGIFEKGKFIEYMKVD